MYTFEFCLHKILNKDIARVGLGCRIKAKCPRVGSWLTGEECPRWGFFLGILTRIEGDRWLNPTSRVYHLWGQNHSANISLDLWNHKFIIQNNNNKKNLECLHSTFRTFDCYQALKQVWICECCNICICI